MAIIDLDAAMAQLRLDPGGDEDDYVQQLVDAATATCEQLTGRFADDADIPTDSDVAPLTEAERLVMGQATLLLVAALYEDREGREDVPAVVTAMLRPLRSLAR